MHQISVVSCYNYLKISPFKVNKCKIFTPLQKKIAIPVGGGKIDNAPSFTSTYLNSTSDSKYF